MRIQLIHVNSFLSTTNLRWGLAHQLSGSPVELKHINFNPHLALDLGRFLRPGSACSNSTPTFRISYGRYVLDAIMPTNRSCTLLEICVSDDRDRRQLAVIFLQIFSN